MSSIDNTIKRAWSDIEPKVYAWLIAGGLLTAVTVIVGYVDPKFPLPIWVAPVVTYLGGALAAYMKKSTPPAPVVPGDHTALAGVDTIAVPDSTTPPTA